MYTSCVSAFSVIVLSCENRVGWYKTNTNNCRFSGAKLHTFLCTFQIFFKVKKNFLKVDMTTVSLFCKFEEYHKLIERFSI